MRRWLLLALLPLVACEPKPPAVQQADTMSVDTAVAERAAPRGERKKPKKVKWPHIPADTLPEDPAIGQDEPVKLDSTERLDSVVVPDSTVPDTTRPVSAGPRGLAPEPPKDTLLVEKDTFTPTPGYKVVNTYHGPLQWTLAKVDTIQKPQPSGSFRLLGLSNYVARGLSENETQIPSVKVSLDGQNAETICSNLAFARKNFIKTIMNMAGGSHEQYKTNGNFDRTKWRARMDTYKAPVPKACVDTALARGEIIGTSVMDEPHQDSDVSDIEEKWWCDPPFLANGQRNPACPTKATIDSMCAYTKSLFPTMPCGVAHNHTKFYPDSTYKVVDFVISQMRLSNTTAKDFATSGAAFAAKNKVKLIYSFNYLHGGPNTNCPKADQPCFATAAQTFGVNLILGRRPEACALSNWRYEPDYARKLDYQQMWKQSADSLARMAGQACRRG